MYFTLNIPSPKLYEIQSCQAGSDRHSKVNKCSFKKDTCYIPERLNPIKINLLQKYRKKGNKFKAMTVLTLEGSKIAVINDKNCEWDDVKLTKQPCGFVLW